MKRILCFCYAILFVACMIPVGYVSADENMGVDEATVERVYSEILSGSITSHEDVLAVAASQISSEAINQSMMRSAVNDAPLTITQVLSETDTEQESSKQVAVTSLSIADEHGNAVSRSVFINHYLRGNGNISSLQIYIVLTMYVTVEETGMAAIVELDHMTGMVVYGTSMVANKLELRYYERLEPVGNATVQKRTINNPVGNTVYSFYPNTTNEMPFGGTLDAYIRANAEVTSGSLKKEVNCTIYADYPPEFDGTW